jgi:hypothetical protein
MERIRKVSIFMLVLIIGISACVYYAKVSSGMYKCERKIDSNVRFYSNYINDKYNYYDAPFETIAVFSWDYAYFFKPGTTKEEIEEIIGFSNNSIPKIVQDGYTQALFVTIRDDIACSIHSKKNYLFYFGDFQDDYIKLSFGKWTKCNITKSGDTGKIILDLSQEWHDMTIKATNIEDDDITQ